jgi:hypothetical protein
MIDPLNATWRSQLETLVSSDYTVPPDQIIRYPTVSNDSRYTFSLFAFPEDEYPAALTDFFKFCKDYYAQKSYRSNLLYVGYYIAQDQKALFSYSHNGAVMTIDPVSTANPGWDQFIDAYNQFCMDRNGMPLLNQTPGLSPGYGAGSSFTLYHFGTRAAIRSEGSPSQRLAALSLAQHKAQYPSSAKDSNVFRLRSRQGLHRAGLSERPILHQRASPWKFGPKCAHVPDKIRRVVHWQKQLFRCPVP